MKNLILFLVVILFIGNINGQDAAITLDADTVYNIQQLHSPARAAVLSAVMPGMGQVYNKKYWKLPLLYGGCMTLVYFIDKYNTDYKFWRDVYYDAKIGGYYNEKLYERYPNADTRFDIEEIATQSEQFKENNRKYRDYNILGLAALYLLNIIDANVDAYFINFDVNRDLAVKVKPDVNKSLLNENIIGLKLCMYIK